MILSFFKSVGYSVLVLLRICTSFQLLPPLGLVSQTWKSWPALGSGQTPGSLFTRFCFNSDTSTLFFEHPLPNTWGNLVCSGKAISAVSRTSLKSRYRGVLSLLPGPKPPHPVINENWVAWCDYFLDKSILAASYYPAISLEVAANRLLAYLFQSLSGDRNYSDWSAIPWISLGPADLKICNFLAKSHFCSC